LERVAAGDAVVSFNWDTLVEFLLCHRFAKTRFRLVQVPNPHITDSVRFAKPHGSLTWNRHRLTGTIDDGHAGPKLGPIPNWKDIMASESGAGPLIEPLLLGAVPIKSELVVEVARPQHEVIMGQWAALCHAISEADELCVMGYSFPHEDGYGRFLMRQAVRRRRRPIARVDLYEVSARFGTVRDAIVEVFGVSPHNVANRGQIAPCP
jgi:hypothetical protein